MSDVLVIGYGNELRSDDAVGRQVADTVAAWQIPGVLVLSVHQLVPELSEELSRAHTVLFIDARSCTQASARLRITRVESGISPVSAGHTGGPEMLLGLAEALYSHQPEAWLITIPARRFEFGETLSPPARRGFKAALRYIRSFLNKRK